MRAVRLLTAGAALALATLHPPANAAACGLAGDLSHSRTLAISLALAGESSAALEAAPDDFVRALTRIVLRQPKEALAYLERSTEGLPPRMADNRRREAISRNSYWAAVALDQIGRPADANAARGIAREQGANFYATLAGGEPTASPGISYPTPRYAYVDQRASTALVWAITREESRFKAGAVSSAGALGLMQVMHGTANVVTRAVGIEVDSRRMLDDPHYNVAVGSTHLGGLSVRYSGYVPLIAAAYNAGEGCADAWLKRLGDPRTQVDATLWIESIPIEETRDYIQRVTSSYSVYLRSGG